MFTFKVEGPMLVPYYDGKAAKTIGSAEAAQFWNSHHAFAASYGCYLFAIRAGQGITPIYVGKATKSFKQEVFNATNLAKYQRGLADYLKGRPVLFLVAAPTQKGARNKKMVGVLEDFLIQTALAANPDLQNVKGTRRDEFAISGVFRSGVGKPSAAAKDLKKCLDLT